MDVVETIAQDHTDGLNCKMTPIGGRGWV